ncbi:MAG: hypothetical protein DRP70_13915 [Spirochaetes bacterium]|nr:MAG: hypothetical protein DRP70_13915 [Spirochaetota bacterium]
MAVDKKNREEQDLERYGVWVKAGPDEINEHESTSLELMEIDDSDQDELLITEEEEKLLGELEESSLPDFGDLDELDDSFENNPPMGDSISSDDESKELLHKIEDELSALRNEIRQLKNELTGMRVPSVSTKEVDPAENGGFFDEEEDETIALTGDELDNILDSADMTEESVEREPEDFSPVDTDFADSGSTESNIKEISLSEDIPALEEPAPGEDEELIDLSDDFTELDLDDVEDFKLDDIEEIEEIEEVEEEEETDPALSILSSPEEMEIEGDPDTIEIEIPSPEEDPVVNIDDIKNDFEDVTDFDDFGLDEADTSQSEAVEIPLVEETEEDFLSIPPEETVLTDSLEEDIFDEGEIVEIDLTETEDDFIVSAESDNSDIEMEEISLDDFGIEESDILAVSEEASAAPNDELNLDDIETVDFESVLADSIDEIEDVELEQDKEITLETDPEDIDYELDIEEITLETDDIDLELEEMDLEPEVLEAEPEDIDLELDIEEVAPELEIPDDNLEEINLDTISQEEFEIEEINLSSPGDDEIPDISLDEAIDEIETVEEFSLDEPVEDLDDEVTVTLPDNDFNELPGTEDVDLDSLDALVTEEAEEAVEEEIADLEETPESTAAGLREKTKAALELSSLPGDLKEEIKEVLKYMDQLLESLPDEKIQEFARSEHFEVYKKIFEELGIND